MKNPPFFFFFATLSLLMASAGAVMMGYYSDRNDDPLAMLGLPLCQGGAALLAASAVVFKKPKGNQDSPR